MTGTIVETEGRPTSWNELIEENPLSLSALLTLTGLLALQAGLGSFFSDCFEDGAASAMASSSSVVLLLLEFKDVTSGDLLVTGKEACRFATVSITADGLGKHKLLSL